MQVKRTYIGAHTSTYTRKRVQVLNIVFIDLIKLNKGSNSIFNDCFTTKLPLLLHLTDYQLN